MMNRDMAVIFTDVTSAAAVTASSSFSMTAASPAQACTAAAADCTCRGAVVTVAIWTAAEEATWAGHREQGPSDGTAYR